MISWHRVVIHGPDRYVPMNPFKPKRNELAFIFVPAGVVLLYMVIMTFDFHSVGKLGGPTITVIVLAAFVIFGLFAAFKIAFYLPARAVEEKITLRESWKMTDGLCMEAYGLGVSFHPGGFS
jgi:hypothetical protein